MSHEPLPVDKYPSRTKAVVNALYLAYAHEASMPDLSALTDMHFAADLDDQEAAAWEKLPGPLAQRQAMHLRRQAVETRELADRWNPRPT